MTSLAILGNGLSPDPDTLLTMARLSGAGYPDRSPWKPSVLTLSTNSAPPFPPPTPRQPTPSFLWTPFPTLPLHIHPCLCPQRLHPSHLEGSTCPWRCLPTGATARPWSWPTIKRTSQPLCLWNRETSRENKVCPAPGTGWGKAVWRDGGGTGDVTCGQLPRVHAHTGSSHGFCTAMLGRHAYVFTSIVALETVVHLNHFGNEWCHCLYLAVGFCHRHM